MDQYMQQIKKEFSEYNAKCSVTDSDSILELLWYCYSASNPIDDGRIKNAELALAPVFRELSVTGSDILFDLISDLCTAYQRAAFLEGLRIGFHLREELEQA